MKFAKRLGSEAVPEWRPKYLQYKQLKKLIKAVIAERESRKKSVVIDFGSGYVIPFTTSEQTFLQFLDNELFKIEDFYTIREKEAVEKKVKIMNQLNLLPDYRGEMKDMMAIMGEGKGSPKSSTITWPSRRSPTAPMEQVSPTTSVTQVERMKIASLRRASYNHLAKLRIKKALLEFYRSLDLLRNFKTLNMLGVGKILKKFDKVTGRAMTQVYADRLSQMKFYSGDTVDNLMTDVENVYRYVFTGGDRSKALRKLRLRDLRNTTFHVSGFLGGMFLMACLVMAIRLVVFVVESMDDITKTLGLIYFGLGLPFLMTWLFAINAAIWESSCINYRFIFEFNQRTTLHICQYMALIGGYCLLYLSMVELSLLGRLDQLIRPFWQPWLVLFLFTVAFLLPSRFPYRSTRMWFARVFMRILTAPFYPCRFKDFFINDQYMSLMGTFDVLGRLLYYSFNYERLSNPFAKPVAWYVFAPPFLPGFWRSLQCLRRYNDSKMSFPHLANLAKYCTSLIVIVLDGLNLYLKTSFLWYALLTARIVSALFSLGWDIVMDFGLWQRSQVNDRLRSTILFRPWIYWYLMISDTSARFLWILPMVHQSVIMTMSLWVVEALRRFQWNIFRVEYEHVNNCNMLRAVTDVQLPYMAADLFYQDMVETIQLQHEKKSAEITNPAISSEESPLSTSSSNSAGDDVSSEEEARDGRGSEIELSDSGSALSQRDPREISLVQKTVQDPTIALDDKPWQEKDRQASTSSSTSGRRFRPLGCLSPNRL